MPTVVAHLFFHNSFSCCPDRQRKWLMNVLFIEI